MHDLGDGVDAHETHNFPGEVCPPASVNDIIDFQVTNCSSILPSKTMFGGPH
jgi:hypothetical protein